jgi:hypothetical protein
VHGLNLRLGNLRRNPPTNFSLLNITTLNHFSLGNTMKTTLRSLRTSIAATLLAAIGMCLTTQATASIDCHLKLDGVKGERTKGKDDCPAPKALDINTAPQATIAAIAGVGPQVAQAIATERGKGLFEDAKDFATRVCSKTSVSFDTTSIVIGQTTYEPKGIGSPKTGGFKCVMGQKDYTYDAQSWSWGASNSTK